MCGLITRPSYHQRPECTKVKTFEGQTSPCPVIHRGGRAQFYHLDSPSPILPAKANSQLLVCLYLHQGGHVGKQSKFPSNHSTDIYFHNLILATHLCQREDRIKMIWGIVLQTGLNRYQDWSQVLKHY